MESHHGEIWAENNVAITKPVTKTTKSANILIIDDGETCLISMELLFFGSGYNLRKAV